MNFINKKDKILFIKNLFEEFFDNYKEIAFKNQLQFMNNINKQYKKRNNLSTKQVNMAVKILNQNKKHIKNVEDISKKIHHNKKII